MRSARMILATAAASAVLTLGAPGAWAAGGDWNHDDSSSSSDSSQGKEHGKEHKKDGDHPHGGMHTGGGALTSITADNWGKEHKKDGDHPHGGMHTGGGALTSITADDRGKEHKKDGDHPHGGMHTGGGALTSITADDRGTARDPKHDPETYKDKGDSGRDDSSWGKEEHDNPHGGMHTGGGALASPSVTAGGLAVLGVAGAGLFVARRKRTAAGVA
ncbi:hypothetical protein JS756_04920 [Streptomyces actuosus]|uniref:Gram-positive cocci surface proteins LPxTG domain-containing protein n=1 Tax=Streptomyces actuosus TaxID=1885 RepID=A0ABS2VK38_STRAS|nr:hypothetical protein [Streptomyces actuosus]MBN0043453.1 hypothetical protein [Streptomyces actuosus]